MNSILQNERRCFICGKQGQLDCHHCWHGNSNRANADTYGLTVNLCRECHTKVHDKAEFDLQLKQFAQRRWEEEYGDRNDFISVFGESAL